MKITIAPGDIGPGWMFPGRGFWRGFGDGCRRLLIADRGPIGGPGGHWTARRGDRCAGIDPIPRPVDRAPGTFGRDQRARPGLVSLIKERQRKGPLNGGPVVLSGFWGF